MRKLPMCKKQDAVLNEFSLTDRRGGDLACLTDSFHVCSMKSLATKVGLLIVYRRPAIGDWALNLVVLTEMLTQYVSLGKHDPTKCRASSYCVNIR